MGLTFWSAERMIFNMYQRKTGIMGDIMVKKSGRVTIKSIAEELGISFSTVAKALNDDPVIRQETRELVQNKAKEMNYTRNYLTHDQLLKGAKIQYQMSGTPNMSRGVGEQDAPYSFSAMK